MKPQQRRAIPSARDGNWTSERRDNKPSDLPQDKGAADAERAKELAKRYEEFAREAEKRVAEDKS